MNPSSESAYMPQEERLGLFHRGISLVILIVLTVCMSIFVMAAQPKITLLLAAFCVLAGGRRLFTPAVWPLLAIVGYDLAVALIFPGPRPSIGLVFQHPLFTIDCMLLSAVALGGQSVRRQHLLMVGVLAISAVGVIGDFTGHDMISLLPLQMPDDGTFDQVALIQGDITRVRGFFPESGVLGAVSLGFATMLGLGAMVLIRAKVRLRFAWTALLAAIGMGGVIFCLTITKTGVFMVVAGLTGFIAVLLSARDNRCRGVALGALACLIIGGAAFLFAGPASLSGYFRGEIVAVVHPDEMGAAMATGHSGMITRYKCWQLAFVTLHHYPFGVGPYGLGTVVQQTNEVTLNHEMQFFFSRDVFGLKNAFANLIAECGIVGLGLLFYWMWTAFVRPIRELLAEGSARSAVIAAVYGASAVSCLVFLFSCELYPSFAFLLVLKFHADAVAQACVIPPRPDMENYELIG
jgi:hypothetical protein